jgi:hypothetical protein
MSVVLNNPQGMAVANSVGYIANTGGNNICSIFLDNNSSSLTLFYSQPNFMPQNIVYNSSTGYLYVIDSVNKQLYVIGLDAKLKKTVTINEYASDITFDNKGNFYIIYRGGPNSPNASIYIINFNDDGSVTNNLLANISSYTYGTNNPTCITYNNFDDCLYYAAYTDIYKLSISQQDANNPVVSTYSYLTTANYPTGLVFDPRGQLYASTVAFNTLEIHKVNPVTSDGSNINNVFLCSNTKNSDVNQTGLPGIVYYNNTFKEYIVYTNNFINTINKYNIPPPPTSTPPPTLSSTKKTKREIVKNIANIIINFGDLIIH